MLSAGSCLIPVAVVGPPEGLFPAGDAFDDEGPLFSFLPFPLDLFNQRPIGVTIIDDRILLDLSSLIDRALFFSFPHFDVVASLNARRCLNESSDDVLIIEMVLPRVPLNTIR